MLSSILASVASYAITNVDDLFVLMLLLGQGRGRGRIAAGHCLGVAALTLLSLLGALGLGNLPIRFTCLLGLVPMALGVRCILARTGKDADAALPAATLSPLGMAAVTLGNGADNLGCTFRCSPVST
jgi:cadmium resistance protein CadD (predicted permease)